DVSEKHGKDEMQDEVPDELRAAREALRHANERMENMLESLSDGFCAVDHAWRITYINGRALEMLAPLRMTRAELTGRDQWDAASDRLLLGQRAAEILGLPAETPLAWSELRARLDPADRERVRRAVLQAFAGHSDLELECRLPGTGSETRWIALVGRADYAD